MVEVLARELQKEFPGAKGYSMQNLWRMRSFYLEYKDTSKLSLLEREISWKNNCTIITKCKDEKELKFYMQMTKRFGWFPNMYIPADGTSPPKSTKYSYKLYRSQNI